MAYYLYKFLFAILKILPWFIIKGLSWGGSRLMFSVFKYRREVVVANVTRSFPEIDERERLRICQDFYFHLIYQLISAPKLLGQSPQEIRGKHMICKDMSLFSDLQAQGKKHFILLMGHCGNWELFSSGQIYFSDFGIQQTQLYRPLKNKALDLVQKEMRTQHGSQALPKNEIGRKMLEIVRNPDSPSTLFAFIADQSPSEGHVGLWIDFLNQETAFLDGAERLARKFDLPVIYMDIKTHNVLCYEATMHLVTDAPKSCSPQEITQKYVRLLEQTIRNNPPYWLWSHKRWKLNKRKD